MLGALEGIDEEAADVSLSRSLSSSFRSVVVVVVVVVSWASAKALTIAARGGGAGMLLELDEWCVCRLVEDAVCEAYEPVFRFSWVILSFAVSDVGAWVSWEGSRWVGV